MVLLLGWLFLQVKVIWFSDLSLIGNQFGHLLLKLSEFSIFINNRLFFDLNQIIFQSNLWLKIWIFIFRVFQLDL